MKPFLSAAQMAQHSTPYPQPPETVNTFSEQQVVTTTHAEKALDAMRQHVNMATAARDTLLNALNRFEGNAPELKQPGSDVPPPMGTGSALRDESDRLAQVLEEVAQLSERVATII